MYIYVTGGLPVYDPALYCCLQITSQIHYQTKTHDKICTGSNSLKS